MQYARVMVVLDNGVEVTVEVAVDGDKNVVVRAKHVEDKKDLGTALLDLIPILAAKANEFQNLTGRRLTVTKLADRGVPPWSER